MAWKIGAMRVRRTDLLDVMRNAVLAAGVTICYGKRLTAVSDGEGEGDDDTSSVKITFSDGTTDTADLLLGCDGLHSAVRSLHVDPDTRPEYSSISTVYSFVPTAALKELAILPLDPPLTAMFLPDGLFVAGDCTAAQDLLFWFFQWELAAPAAGEDNKDGWEERGCRAERGFRAEVLRCLEGVGGGWGELLRDVVSKTDVVRFYPIFRLPLGGRWFR